jgi:uncharacterized damage-inducible protein DinB
MYRTVEDFRKSLNSERENTLKVLRALTDASLAQAVGPGGRSLGRIAWHITQMFGEMGGQMHLPVEAAGEKTPQPATAKAIADAYDAGSNALAKGVQDTWSDADLLVEIEMYGEKWARGYALWGLIAHEIHHRGQMTVLMRQAGLKVPGVYGPSKEEWASYGMPAQE